ncbi:hypothetical protein [Lentzea sp. HUAS12]|uniref:hypothetical protein n=1 Tax=Lentzea sp. HUAS12 TaxID=2951806 RepID=UPI00209EC734|nr:hypothetical protein [Lentzea sp. HUAS12]USX56042.1 hypothetical protein ND450_18690 [Lentzea sp. HUAS12]
MSLLSFGIVGAVRGTPWALEGFGGQRVLALVGWGLVVLVVGNFLRRFVFGPWVTVSRDGLSSAATGSPGRRCGRCG